MNQEWCIPPKAHPAFVAQMEDVLDVYTRPLDPKHPQVCFDESSKQQVKEVRMPLPVAPGQPARYDTEYERNGVSNLFMCFAPLLNWRHVTVTDQRTAVVIQLFETAEDMSAAEAPLDEMDPGDTPGTRASIDRCEIKAELTPS